MNIPEQLQYMDLEQRRMSRYGASYVAYKEMASKLSKLGNVILLIPPEGYLEAMHVQGLHAVEPSLFYYFTGMNAVLVTSPTALMANWAVTASPKGDVSVTRLRGVQQADSQIVMFKRYQP